MIKLQQVQCSFGACRVLRPCLSGLHSLMQHQFRNGFVRKLAALVALRVSRGLLHSGLRHNALVIQSRSASADDESLASTLFDLCC